MKNAIRCALCLLMGATSVATYAGDGYETTTWGYDGPVAAAQPSESEAPMVADDGHGSGEPMRANADDARSSEKTAIDELNRERLNRENWSATP